jgi:hypothetical protein
VPNGAVEVSGAPLGTAVRSPATDPPGVGLALGRVVVSGSDVGATLGFGVGLEVGGDVGAGVAVGAGVTSGSTLADGVAVGLEVGATVGLGLAVALAVAVGRVVGAALGDGLGLRVGVVVGEAVGRSPEQSTLNTFCLSPPGWPVWLQKSLYCPSGSEWRSGYAGTRTSAAEPEVQVPCRTVCPPGCVAMRHVPDVPTPRKKWMWNRQTLGLLAGPSDSVLPSWILTVPAANVSAEPLAARGTATEPELSAAVGGDGVVGAQEPKVNRTSTKDASRLGSRRRRG